MALSKIHVLRLDPYNMQHAWLIPNLIPRLIDVANAIDMAGAQMVPSLLSRLYAKDPAVIVMVAVTDKGDIKGQGCAVITDGKAFILHPKMDEPSANDAVGEMLHAIEAWAVERGAPVATLLTSREDPKWLKKYGYGTTQYVSTKSLLQPLSTQ